MTMTSPEALVGPAPMGKSAPMLPTSYRASAATDGSIVVEDVPIFAENKRGDQVYDRKWLAAALAADRSLRASGYKAPMHFGHHEVAVTRERAGHFELTRVGRYVYQGKPRWVLFARLTFKDQASLDRALKDYHYRSVEISARDAPNEINSLALLSTEAPYFRFPNLENLTFAALTDGRVAFAWRTKFMLADKKPEAEAAPVPPVAAAAATPAPAGAEAPEAPAEEKKEEAFNKVVLAKIDHLIRIFEDHLIGKETEPGHDEEVQAEAEVAPGAEEDEAPIVAASAKPDEHFAALEGKVAGLQSEVERLRKELAGKELFAALAKDLGPYNVPNLEKELTARIAASHEAAKAWAAGVTSFAPKTKRPDEDPQETSQSQDAPEIAHYAQFGADKLAEARRLATMYQAAPPRSLVRNKPLAAFLAAQPSLETN